MVDVRTATHRGQAAVLLTTRALRLIAITHRGPRIAHFGPRRGDNLLYWAPGQHARDDWDPLGGHRLWTTRPGADECEETYRPDNEPCKVRLHRDGFTLTAPIDPVTRLERGFSVRSADPRRLVIRHFARNTSDMLWSGGLWGVTVTVPAKRIQYIVPLTDDSPWETSTIVLFNRWGDNRGGGGFHDPQFSLTHDALILRPTRRENKRLIQASAGIVAMYDPKRGVLFAKYARYDANARYPRGANLSLYTGGAKNFYVEMESLGPFVTLQPRESVEHTETWVLRNAPARAPTAASLRELFN